MTGPSTTVSGIVQKYGRNKDMLIEILLEIQMGLGWLPREALAEVGKELGIPPTRVYQVATFYRVFRFTPYGKHRVGVCMGTACQVRGASLIRDKVKQILGIEPGESSPDMKFSLEAVNCPGCCAMAPVVTVDDECVGDLTVDGVENALNKCLKD